MKTLLSLMFGAAVLAAVGCGTTEQSYMADQPPPLARGNAKSTDLDSPALPPPGTRVAAEDIAEDNVQDSLKKLESEMKFEKRAVSKVGK